MNPSSRIRSRPRSTSALAYSLSHLVFGVTSLAHGLLSYVDGDAVAAAFFTLGGVGIVAFVAYETVDSGSSETPEEWGPLVYVTVLGALLFVVATVWQSL